MQGEGNYYVIGHLTMMTGLSDRTIRSYLASGFLREEKIDGVWHFTPQQVEEFIRHPAVRPSIRAKSNAIVYDFLLSNRKAEAELCMILDAPRADRKALAEFFSDRISEGDYRHIEFSFDGAGKEPRVILKGRAPDVPGADECVQRGVPAVSLRICAEENAVLAPLKKGVFSSEREYPL